MCACLPICLYTRLYTCLCTCMYTRLCIWVNICSQVTWEWVVLDEGHTIKGEASQLAALLRKVESRGRARLFSLSRSVPTANAESPVPDAEGTQKRHRDLFDAAPRIFASPLGVRRRHAPEKLIKQFRTWAGSSSPALPCTTTWRAVQLA